MGQMSKHSECILSELKQVFEKNKDLDIDKIINYIKGADKVVGVGAGRVGYSLKAFIMRLGHFDVDAYMLGDTTVPRTNKNDLLIVASGSGETKSTLQIVKKAKEYNVKVFGVIGKEDSTIAKLCDDILILKIQESKQPMTTLNEQSLYLLFDMIVLRIQELFKIDNEEMKTKHSILE